MGCLTIPSQRISFLKKPSTMTNTSVPSRLNPNFNGICISPKVSWSTHSLAFSRKLRKRCREMHEGNLGKFLCKVFDSSKDGECRITEGKSCTGIRFLHSVEEHNIMATTKHTTASNFMSYQIHLKLMMLCGFFTLQGAQQAVASSDIASQLSSISFLGDTGDISTGFASAFLLIFFSELGDKTFFIAALLAARNSAAVVFLGTFGALGAMTIISVILGRTFHYVDGILPFRFGDADLPIDDIAAAFLLVYFGVSTLLEASSGDRQKTEEEQKEAELAVSEFSGNGAGILAVASTVISTFLLVFVAEWGDKSFFSTIALAAASSPLGVVGGALAGHGVATLLAVLGGSLMGTFLSEKVIAYIGGTLFLVFAVVTLIEIVS
ncbi:GDT1-like protein 1, chloroplastic [Coffea eugenioides]|uniref:GDT1-like protein 1, chloroplastic n=1 Tax=Coffea eugenioides TaxID=49369 RepID=UPI000F60CB35|nr:GDT1-like protein 1, chloroplastic [Coffea eugenioides]